MQPRTTHTAPRSGMISAIKRVAHRAIAVRAGMVARCAESLSREALNRRVLYRLSVLSDRELGDIGLTRWDVRDAAALGSGDDATIFLTGRREGRRTSRLRRYPF